MTALIHQPLDVKPADRMMRTVHAAPVAPPAPVSAARPVTTRLLVTRAGVWGAVILAGIVLVLYGLEPLFQQRDQRQLLSTYRVQIEHAANEALGLPGIEIPTKAVEPGAPVGVLEVGGVQLQQVVVEGVTPSFTAIGPGHVPGTAGLGQPGNAVVVGRRGTFGGPFAELGSVRKGDRILVTTTQGQSIYVVDSNREVALTATPAAPADVTVDDPTATTGTVPSPASSVVAGSTLDLEAVFGRSGDARLTLVSSASASPLNSSMAQVVVAKLEGQAFTPTPQGARTDSQTGTQGDGTAWAPLLLAALAYGVVGAAAVLLYRRSSGRVAYLLTIAPLVAVTIVMAETLSRLLPAWT